MWVHPDGAASEMRREQRVSRKSNGTAASPQPCGSLPRPVLTFPTAQAPCQGADQRGTWDLETATRPQGRESWELTFLSSAPSCWPGWRNRGLSHANQGILTFQTVTLLVLGRIFWQEGFRAE